MVSLAQTLDNTATNKGNQGTATADQQKENAGDGNLARKIRQSLLLSTPDDNVTGIARNGEATREPPPGRAKTKRPP